MSTARYFEVPGSPIPELLGFPKGMKVYTSGTVNPVGRASLERWACALAENDARFLADGGNGYTIGQPVLREFLTEYRRLPDTVFTLRPDAVDPVAVCELRSRNDFYFYAVNRERYPVEIEFTLSGSSSLKRLSSGESHPAAEPLVLKLDAYQLATFKAPADVSIVKTTVRPPQQETDKTAARVKLLADAVERIEKEELGERLNPDEVGMLRSAADQAQAALKKGWLWRARMLTEWKLRPLFGKLNAYPPYFSDGVEWGRKAHLFFPNGAGAQVVGYDAEGHK